MRTGAASVLPVLLLSDEVEQPGREAGGVLKAGDRGHVVVVGLEQLEQLCGARDVEGLLFVVADARLDQDREIAVVVVGGLHDPVWRAGPNGLGDDVGLA